MKALWQNISSYWEGIYKLEHPVREEWATPNKVVLEQGNLRLRHFINSDVEEHRPVLILPPQAGHHSNLADYASDQSLVRVFFKRNSRNIPYSSKNKKENPGI